MSIMRDVRPKGFYTTTLDVHYFKRGAEAPLCGDISAERRDKAKPRNYIWTPTCPSNFCFRCWAEAREMTVQEQGKIDLD